MALPTFDPEIRQAAQFLRAGKLADAESVARQVLEQSPNYPPALHCLGLIAQSLSRHGEAAILIQKAIAADPNAVDYRYNLSLSLSALGDIPGAEAALRNAIRLRPGLAEAHTNLGALLQARGDAQGAIASFREVVRIRPEDPHAFLNLGKVLRGEDKLDEAEANFRRAIALAPLLAPAWNMLGSCLREGGKIADAVQAFANAVKFDPHFREAHDNLCYAMYFHPRATPEQVLTVHRDWAEKFGAPAGQADVAHSIDRSPDRPLRIGFISPNFREHAVGSFVEPIFAHHDRSQFVFAAYSDLPNADQTTSRLRASAELWRDTAALNDQALADLVRQDRIDILIDLTLHMRGSRLGVFAQRPAPLQMTHLAYCGTSGLTQIDCCIADPQMIRGDSASFFTERLVPLPQTYWCYRAPAVAPEVGPLPAQGNGYITFGSMNSLAKVNDEVIEVWSKLLERLPTSRLAVFAPGAAFNPSIRARFEKYGIPGSRLAPIPRQELPAYFQTYSRIDIALDPFPYNGGTTTLDALWMGVPVISLAGRLPVGRGGASILTNVRLPDLVATTPAEYVDRAAALAANPTALAALRSDLRSRMRSSPLLDAQSYVRNLEAVFRSEWASRLRRQNA